MDKRYVTLCAAAAAFVALGCGTTTGGHSSASGGATGSGGMPATGGQPAAGTGGQPGVATGGQSRPATGGVGPGGSGVGGVPGTGGTGAAPGGVGGVPPSTGGVPASTRITPAGDARAAGAVDQDDMAFWIHPTDAKLSTLISSDKSSLNLNVYDNRGISIQTLKAPGKPGNIDVRYGMPLGDKQIDIVAFNDRGLGQIVVYGIDSATQMIARIDNNAIATAGMNYGFCLYKSASKKIYAFVTFEITGTGKLQQFELADDGTGKVKGTMVREWTFTTATFGEACVVDDENATLYYADEVGGIYQVGAEPTAPTPGALFTGVGANGLTADVEGLTIYPTANGGGYILTSSQGSDTYLVYDRAPPHPYRGTFSLVGAAHTDGIDVTNVDIGGICPGGCFVAHGGNAPASNFMVKWGDIATALGLKVDTTYNPRH